MRQIKFRTWDYHLQYMFYDIQRAYEGLPYPQREHDVDKYDKLDEEICPQSFDTFLELDRFEVMQYTGLKDKHSKEIYEGDIVKIDDTHLAVVEYESDGGYYYAKDGLDNLALDDFLMRSYMLDVEIVGNVHDNPELVGA